MADFPTLDIRASCGGHGVFALGPIAAGTRILRFTGERVDREVVAAAADGGDGHDGFLQIDDDVYLGLSGGADDYVNHSCEPNCYVAVERDGIHLVALTDIAAGAELFFDYGVTQIDFPFRFRCLCGSAACRGEIGNYDEIPPATLARYRARDMIPPHVRLALGREGG